MKPLSELYVGVDLHLKTLHLSVMDSKGNIQEKRKLPAHRDIVSCYLDNFPLSTSISVEATRNWHWFVELLEEKNFTPKLVHPKKVRLIAEAAIKTDDIDSEVLAHLDRLNFLPLSYIPSSEERCLRELLRMRAYLVKIRTALKNRVYALLAKLNLSYHLTDLFGKRGRLFLKELNLKSEYQHSLNTQLEAIDYLDNKINDINKLLNKNIELNPQAKLLITIPGLGKLLALLLAVEIGPISRFRNHKKLISLAGLSSRISQSDNKTYYGHINKDSNPYIRWALIEAVPHVVKKDPKYRAYYQKIAFKKGRQKAKVAVAKKLLVAIYYMLKNNSPFKLSHNLSLNTKKMSRLSPYNLTGNPQSTRG